MDNFLRAALGNAALATLLALLAAGASSLLGRKPALRHALWLLVLLKLVTPPLSLVTFDWVRVPEAEPPRAPVESTASEVLDEIAVADAPDVPVDIELSETAVTPAASVIPSLWRLASAAWLAGTVVVLIVALVRVWRWNRLLVLLRPAPAEVQARLEDLATRMGLRVCPILCWLPGTAAPMLSALGRARIIVPTALWDELDDRQRTTIMIHELAHFRRRDHWVRLLELVATTFYWWLPPVWLARRALREAEEQCCDAWVVSLCPKDARTYAETLLQTVDFLSESAPALPLAACGFGQVHSLKRRVIMIMRGTTPRSLNVPGALGVVALAALLLPLSPTWAQDRGDDRAPDKPDTPVATTPKVSGSPDLVENLDALKQDSRQKLLILDKKLRALKEQQAELDNDDPATRDAQSADAAKRIDQYKRAFQAVRDEAKRDAQDAARDRATAADVLKGKLRDAIELDDDESPRKTQGSAAQLARAKAEVARAKAQLQAAEKRLAALQASGGSSSTKPKPGTGDNSYRKSVKGLFDKDAKGTPPASERRIAEIEATLQKLIDEIKILKSEREKPR